MFKEIIHKIKSKKIFAILISVTLILISIGIQTSIPEIKTLSFFILLEMLVIAVALITALTMYRTNIAKFYLQNSFSNFILGLHIAAGMIVLGVYFTV
jgi:hypothetical protein